MVTHIEICVETKATPVTIWWPIPSYSPSSEWRGNHGSYTICCRVCFYDDDTDSTTYKSFSDSTNERPISTFPATNARVKDNFVLRHRAHVECGGTVIPLSFETGAYTSF